MPLDLDTHTANLVSSGAQRFRGVEELDEANRSIGWTMEYRQLEAGASSAMFRVAEHHGMVLSGEFFSTRVHILALAPQGVFSFVLPVTQGQACRAHGRTFGTGHMILFPGGSAMEIATFHSSGDLVLTVADAELETTADALFPAAELPVGHADPIVPAAQDRLGVIGGGISAVLSNGRTEPEFLSELLARCIALVADSSGGAREERLLGNDAAGEIVARAREFIEDRYTRPIRIEELCRVSGVGVRKLQRVFRERLGVSPTGYLKARRLNAARRLLAAAAPQETTVTEVAHRCGFAHLGRFSVDYRSYFGEPPSRTIHR